jgi:hypothetical protein
MEPQKTQNSLSNLEQKEQRWSHHNTWSQNILQSCSNQKNMAQALKPIHTPMENSINSEINLHVYGQLIYGKGGNWSKDGPLSKCFWGNCTFISIWMKLEPISHYIQK